MRRTEGKLRGCIATCDVGWMDVEQATQWHHKSLDSMVLRSVEW